MTEPNTSSQKGAKTTQATGSLAATADQVPREDPLVQYILVRTDLGWGPGATVAQACHASVAAIAQTLDSSPTTRAYLADLENMHKIVLRADKLDDLLGAERRLREAHVAHHLWVERPENVASCLAVSPQPKSTVQAIFKHFKLFK